MVKSGKTFCLFPPPDSVGNDNIHILDEYLRKRLFQISPRIRFIVVPSDKIKTVHYIRNYEKLFYKITKRDVQVSLEEFNQLTEIYASLKHYIKELSGDSLAIEMINTRFELLSKIFDVDVSEFLLIDALRRTN